MAALTNCPRCDVSLIVPAALVAPHPHGRFRCPACQAEVEVSEAFAAVHKTVLEAIPLSFTGAPLVADSSAASGTATADESPLGAEAAGREESASSEPATFAFAPAIASSASSEGSSTATADSASEADDDASGSDDRPSFGGFQGSADRDDDYSSRRRRPQGGSFLRSLVGIVLGGVVGIGGGLLVLRAVQGDKFRSPVPLPELPAWATDWLKPTDHPADQTGESIARSEWTGGGPLTEMPYIPPPANLPPERGASRDRSSEATADASPRTLPAPTSATSSPDAEPFALPTPAATAEATPAGPAKPSAIVKGAPQRRPADVSQAMAAAAGKIGAGPKGSTPIDAPLYADLTTLAESLAFLETDDDATRKTFRDEAGKFLATVVFGRANLEAASALAVERLTGDSPSGTGVVLAGQIVKQAREPNFWVFEIEPFTSRRAIVVLVPERQGLLEYDRVLVAGAIVPDPAVNVAGYKGDVSRVVWAGHVSRLAREATGAVPAAPKKAPPATPPAAPGGDAPPPPALDPGPAAPNAPAGETSGANNPAPAPAAP